MFIQTEATPNPDTLKFLPGKDVLGEGTLEFSSIDEAGASPMAQRLFDVPGVARVFLGSNFVSVTKTPDADWRHVKTMSLAAIMDHYTSGMPVVDDASAGNSQGSASEYEGDAAEIVSEIKSLHLFNSNIGMLEYFQSSGFSFEER